MLELDEITIIGNDVEINVTSFSEKVKRCCVAFFVTDFGEVKVICFIPAIIFLIAGIIIFISLKIINAL
jgi:hypothetical protein